MPRKKPPSEELFARAAELRAAGVTWETIAKEVNRAVRTVYYWPRKYPKLWADALLQAERDMNSQSDSEAVRGLRGMLMSQDEKIRWHAAKSLIVRRIERDKIDLKSPPPKPPSAPKRPSSSLSSMDYPMKNSPTASPQCPPPPNSHTPRNAGCLRWARAAKRRPRNPNSFIPLGLNDSLQSPATVRGAPAPAPISWYAMTLRTRARSMATPNVAGSRPASRTTSMNLLEPEGHFWSLFTPWHGDDLNARQKKNPTFALFPRPIGPDFKAIWPAKWPRKRPMARKNEIGSASFAPRRSVLGL